MSGEACLAVRWVMAPSHAAEKQKNLLQDGVQQAFTFDSC